MQGWTKENVDLVGEQTALRGNTGVKKAWFDKTLVTHDMDLSH